MTIDDAVTPGSARSTRVAAAVVVGFVVLGIALRFVHLDGHFISDEGLDGIVARMPFGDMLRYLRDHEVHPPLEYLLRAPMARHSAEEWPMRLPSVLASCAALAVLAVWLRRRPGLAVVAVGGMSLGAFQLVFAWMARPYALMALAGTATAWLAYRWLGEPTTRDALAVGAVVLVGLFVHESMLVVLPGLVLVPGVRRDPAAWRWRASVVGAFALWGVTWGPSFVHQLSHSQTISAYVPTTSGSAVIDMIAELVNFEGPFRVPMVIAVLAGGAALRWVDARLFRVWVCGFAVTVATVMVLGLSAHLVWSKTMAVASWGVFVGAAGGVVALWDRWRRYGAVAALLVAALVIPGTLDAVDDPYVGFAPTWTQATDRLQQVVRPGDAVGTSTDLRPPTRWYVGLHARNGPAALRAVWPDVFLVDGQPWTGRVWSVTAAVPPGFDDCSTAADRDAGVRCWMQHP